MYRNDITGASWRLRSLKNRLLVQANNRKIAKFSIADGFLCQYCGKRFMQWRHHGLTLISLDYRLVLNCSQAIIYANADPVHRRIVCLEELKPTFWLLLACVSLMVRPRVETFNVNPIKVGIAPRFALLPPVWVTFHCVASVSPSLCSGGTWRDALKSFWWLCAFVRPLFPIALQHAMGGKPGAKIVTLTSWRFWLYQY